MRKFLVLISVILTLAMLCGCAGVSGASDELSKGLSKNNVTGKVSDDDFTLSQYDFAAKLLKESFSADEKENTLISPLSVMLALSMTANGAGGDTLSEMENLLADGMDIDTLNNYLYSYVNALPSSKTASLSIANSVWFRDRSDFSVKEDFLQKNTDYYGADIYKAPFDKSTVKDINGWVNKNTDGMIKEIIKDIDDNTMMYLINAICFDAEWERIYEEFDVRDRTFTTIGGKKKNVSMMHSDENVYLEDDDSTGFIKYYKDRKYAFAAVLPNEGVDFSSFINSLSGEKMKHILQSAENTAVVTALPKFKTETSLDMNPVLKSLGMKKAFEADSADFKGISDMELYISRVLHKTYISVDERGTKAGAVTSVAVDGEGFFERKEVCLDRPFVYMIIDCENKLPIFFGTVTDIGE